MPVVTLTRKARNLGYGWTNRPVQRYNSRGEGVLGIARVQEPGVTGGPRAILAERRHAARVNSGGAWWNEAVFVGGRAVVAVNGFDGPGYLDDLFWFLAGDDERAAVRVTLAGAGA